MSVTKVTNITFSRALEYAALLCVGWVMVAGTTSSVRCQAASEPGVVCMAFYPGSSSFVWGAVSRSEYARVKGSRTEGPKGG